MDWRRLANKLVLIAVNDALIRHEFDDVVWQRTDGSFVKIRFSKKIASYFEGHLKNKGYFYLIIGKLKQNT